MKSSISELLLKGLDQLGLDVDQACLDKFALLAQELVKWNRKINLTSIEHPDEIVIKHFIDSLTIAEVVGRRGRLLDIGSGAGFPGIPLKIVLPELQVVSVDSVEKKIIFQRSIARLLKLEDFTAMHARIESLPEKLANGFDRIVSRAYADIQTFARVALPLLKSGGIIIAMKGAGGKREAEESADGLKLLGARIISIHEFTLPLSDDFRTIIQLKRTE
jgi:16S rRNA (guanine527-N7)-methyltransferase